MRKLTLVTAIVAMMFASAANAADRTLALDTSKGNAPNWTISYYGQLGATSYDPTQKDTYIAGMRNSAYLVKSYTGNDIRVYDQQRDYSVLGGSWDMDLAGSPWIGMRNGQSARDVLSDPSNWCDDTLGDWNLAGFYTYSISFEVLAGEAGSFSGNFWKDNDILGIYLTKDGDSSFDKTIAYTPDRGSYTDERDYKQAYEVEYGKGPEALTEGKYTLTFYVTNGWSEQPIGTPNNWDIIGPTGLRSDIGGFAVKNVTPEPATLAIFGLGLVGAGFAARRRTQK